MRKFTILLIVAILLGVFAVPVAAAGPASYASTVAVTNTSGISGTVNLIFYNPNGTIADDSISDPINSLETKYYTTLPVSAGFKGSMIIQSDVPLGSTSTLMGKNASGSVINYASYVGVSAGGSKVYLPLLMKNNFGYNTYYSVQNTGTATINVSVNYSDGSSRTISSLKPGAAYFVDNQLETHSSKKFSAILSTTGEIAVAAVEWGDGSYGRPLYAYNGFESGDPKPVIPMVNQNNYGFWTAIPIQNLGTSSTTVTLTYVPTKAGSTCKETMTIPAGGDKEFGTFAHAYAPQTPGTTCVLGQRFVGIATVTQNSNNQPIVAIQNQLNRTSPNDKGEVLMSIAPSTATSRIVFPEVYQWYTSVHWFTALTLTNVSGHSLPAGDIVCRGVGTASGSPVNKTWTNTSSIADGQGWITDLYDSGSSVGGPLVNNFKGSVICESASGEIVGNNNTLAHGSAPSLDAFVLYEGINLTD